MLHNRLPAPATRPLQAVKHKELDQRLDNNSKETKRVHLRHQELVRVGNVHTVFFVGH
jgi:hypothetical protein